MASKLKEINHKLYRLLQEKAEEPYVGHAIRNGSQEALSLYQAVQRIHETLSAPKTIPMSRHTELDQAMAKAITRLDHQLEAVFKDPSEVRQALEDIIWKDGGLQMQKLLRYPEEFGPLKKPFNRAKMREVLQGPRDVRGRYQEFLLNLSTDEVEAYFRSLPQSLEGKEIPSFQLSEGAAVTGLEMMKASHRWMAQASQTEAGRAVFSMSARAVKYGAAIARMFRQPVKGPVSLTLHIITEAMRGGIQTEREYDRDKGLSR